MNYLKYVILFSNPYYRKTPPSLHMGKILSFLIEFPQIKTLSVLEGRYENIFSDDQINKVEYIPDVPVTIEESIKFFIAKNASILINSNMKQFRVLLSEDSTLTSI